MACLTVMDGPKEGRCLDLAKNRTKIIGRDHTCALIVSGRKVSRWHCEVFFNGKRCLLTDLDSTNGTRVNGKKRAKAVLRSGDVVKIGPVRFRFELAAPTMPTLGRDEPSDESSSDDSTAVALDFIQAFKARREAEEGADSDVDEDGLELDDKS